MARVALGGPAGIRENADPDQYFQVQPRAVDHRTRRREASGHARKAVCADGPSRPKPAAARGVATPSRPQVTLARGCATRPGHTARRTEVPLAAVGFALDLNPLVVLVVTIAAGCVLGMIGLVLAAPLTSAAVHIADDLRRTRVVVSDGSAG